MLNRYVCLFKESPGDGIMGGRLSGRGFQFRFFFFKTLMVFTLELQVALTDTCPGVAEEKTR